MRLLKICLNFIFLLIGYCLSAFTYVGFAFSIYWLATNTNVFTTKNRLLLFLEPFINRLADNDNIFIVIITILLGIIAFSVSWIGPIIILWLMRCIIDYPIICLMKKNGHQIFFNIASLIPRKTRKKIYNNYNQHEERQKSYQQQQQQYEQSYNQSYNNSNNQSQSTSSESSRKSAIPEVEKAKFTLMLDDLTFTKKELKLIRNKFIKKFHSDNAEENEAYAQKINVAYDVLLPYAKEDPK